MKGSAATTRALRLHGPLYRGTALAVPLGPPKTGRRRPRLALTSLAVLALVVAFAWMARGGVKQAWRRLPFSHARVTVSGNEYLSAAEVRRAAGLAANVPFFRVDVGRACTRLSRHRRVAAARVERRLNGEVHVHIVERLPVVLVQLGGLVEADRDGVLLPPLVNGALPDLPVVSGLAAAAGSRLRDPDFARALAWVRALGASEVGLAGRVSEVDVSSPRETDVVLAPDGARLLLPRLPAQVSSLSALRVVLADLAARGRRPASIDCRARGVAVVRPLPEDPAIEDEQSKAKGGARPPVATAENARASGRGRRG